jgi:hypothetical protein
MGDLEAQKGALEALFCRLVVAYSHHCEEELDPHWCEKLHPYPDPNQLWLLVRDPGWKNPESDHRNRNIVLVYGTAVALMRIRFLFLFDADPKADLDLDFFGVDPDPTYHPDADPDPYSSFQIKAQTLFKVLK